MTLRQRIVDHIARTISAGEAREANILLGLLIVGFADFAGVFLEATTEQLSQFLSSHRWADTTMARKLSTMRLIFAALVEWGLIRSNPAIDVARPSSVVDKAPDFDVSTADVATLIAYQEDLVKRLHSRVDGYAHRDAHGARVTLASMHLVASGALLAEIETLTMQDLRAHTVFVGRGTSRERLIWPSDSALGMIGAAAHAARPLPPAPDAPLLLGRRGATLDTKLVSSMLRAAIRRAGLARSGLTPAKIHRAAAKGLIESGFGWNEARIPSGYRRIPKISKKPSVDEMERAIANAHPLDLV
jgi:site-specific recombinase XerD